MSKPRILYIDDEQINLTNFKQAFSRDYEIFTVPSGEEALALIAREGEMAAVISDQRMPGISGIDVLFRVNEIHPDSVRLVITGFTAVGDLLDSINRGQIYKYIVKPWDQAYLEVTLRNATERYSLTKRNKELMAELENRVAQRTHELLTANSSLQLVNDELNKAHLRMQAQSTTLQSMNTELNEKVVELERALAKVKILQGLLPICSYCKKIRDDRNYWQELESYMHQHADISFTHGICPDCYDLHVKADLEQFQQEAKRRREIDR